MPSQFRKQSSAKKTMYNFVCVIGSMALDSLSFDSIECFFDDSMVGVRMEYWGNHCIIGFLSFIF
jgi:hypothetical protein